MQDWLGNDLGVGDMVIYPAGSGRSITMVVGQIVDFGQRRDWSGEEKTAPTIKIQPLGSSRWEQHYGTDYYVDTRTGKRIDPYRPAGDGSYPHIAQRAYYLGKDGTRHPNQDWSGNDAQRVYVDAVFAEHVEKRHDGPKVVTIQITENVTKWTGQLPPPTPAYAAAGTRAGAP